MRYSTTGLYIAIHYGYPIYKKFRQYSGRYTLTLHNTVYSYLPTPPLGQDMTQGQFLSGV